jgi:Uncharacterized conserved protein (COG2071)
MIFQKNPIPVRGDLQRTWFFCHRTPEAAARALVPSRLELITHGGFAFWNVVVCQLAAMRPAFIPAALGIGYWHVAYRLLVRVRLADGRTVEGLYFVRSDCDSRLVAWPGNWLTDFRFASASARVSVEENTGVIAGEAVAPGANGSFVLHRYTPSALAAGSPFSSYDEAAEFLRYKPASIAPHGANAVNIVTIRRDEAAWRMRPIHATRAEWQWLAGRDATLEVAYEAAPIRYGWRRGEVCQLAP